MNKTFQYLLGVGVSLLFPLSAMAFTADLQSISPTPQQDISDMMGSAPERVVLAGWVIDETDIQNGTTYTAVFSVDEEPAGVIAPGTTMSVDAPPVYDAATGTYTVQFVPSGMKQPTDSDSPENVAIIALVGVADNTAGEDGPPAEMTGFWLSTNVQNWALIPPSPDQATPAFGYSLTGPIGETGSMTVFMPDGIKNLLSTYSGQTLTWADLAVFDGDNQASLDITKVTGGAVFDLNVIFSESATTTPSAKTTTVTKTLTVQKQLPISLVASKTELNKGKQFSLYGWLKNGKQNQTITVWQKKSGDSNYTKIDTLTTAAAGYYTQTYTAKTTAKYKVKYHKNGKTITSTAIAVTVNN